MKDYTSPSTKSNKRLLSSLSPTGDKQLKKTKYFTKRSKKTPTIGPAVMDLVTSMQMDEPDKLEKNHIPSVRSQIQNWREP